jgi:uncharacterized phage protein gp47/JayE
MNGTGGNPATVTYGVTDRGFLVKPLQAILSDAFARAQQVFGPDIDLRSSSAFRKVIELGSLEPALLWMALDDAYHSGFTSTASGDALDLLGADLGLDRSRLGAVGVAAFGLSPSAPPGAVLTLPPGTLIETAAPVLRFRLIASLTLSNDPAQNLPSKASAAVSAVQPGLSGNIAASQLARINPTFAARYLNFDPTFITVGNPAPFTGGEAFEDDSVYRRKLQEQPRGAWTPDAVRGAVLEVDGVRDALVIDPYGGLDTSAVPFGGFCFGDSVFRAARDLTNPYFFKIVVAAEQGVVWETQGTGADQIEGLSGQILQRLEPIRPVSTFPTLVQADAVEVSLRVVMTLNPGASPDSVLAAARLGVAAYISTLRLGDAVLSSQVLRILTELPGVKDVQSLRLRRGPSRFGEVVFGAPVVFANGDDLARLEAPCGGNIVLAENEVAVFDGGSGLMDLETRSP